MKNYSNKTRYVELQALISDIDSLVQSYVSKALNPTRETKYLHMYTSIKEDCIYSLSFHLMFIVKGLTP